MTNTALLRKLIREKGLKLFFIADCLGISPISLKRKIDNVTEFRPSQIVQMCEILGIETAEEREQIFLLRK